MYLCTNVQHIRPTHTHTFPTCLLYDLQAQLEQQSADSRLALSLLFTHVKEWGQVKLHNPNLL